MHDPLQAFYETAVATAELLESSGDPPINGKPYALPKENVADWFVVRRQRSVCFPSYGYTTWQRRWAAGHGVARYGTVPK